MNYKTILYEVKDGIAKITLNRPDVLNAINPQMTAELNAALKNAEDDSNVKIVVITGAGRAFCAGADIKEFLSFPTPADMQYQAERREREFRLNETYTKPVIAMVHGYCLGGGFEIAQQCDIIIASEDARFGQPEINVVGLPGMGGTQRLPRLIGARKALELIMTGDIIDAKEADKLGIVNKLVPREKLEETVNELAQKLSGKSPVFLRFAKAAVYRGLELPLNEGLAWESMLFATCFTTEDQKEASSAFVEKRKPVFKGK